MAPARTINDVVDDLGCGGAQARLVTFAGGIYWADGCITIICAALPAVIAQELGLHPYERAMMLSSLLVGKMVGNYSNFVSDTYFNRRVPILIGYALSIAAALTATFCYSVWPLAACWVLCGFSFGFSTPAWNALAVETSPQNKRMLISGISHIWFTVAALGVYLTMWYYSPTLDYGSQWRVFLRYLLIPCAVLLLGAMVIGFVDSPHVYASWGSDDRARSVLETIRYQNGQEGKAVDFVSQTGKKDGTGVWSSVSVLFGRHYRLITMVVCLNTFTLNFTGYGMYYSTPMIARSLETGVPPAALLCILPCTEFLGYLSATFLSRSMTRRCMLAGYQITVAALAVALTLLVGSAHGSFPEKCFAVCCVVVLFVMAHGWLLVYVYASEVFPTACRGFAGGFTLGVGRFGSISAPPTYEHLHILTGSLSPFYGVLVLLMLANAALVLLVLPETKGRPLDDQESEAELRPLKAAVKVKGVTSP